MFAIEELQNRINREIEKRNADLIDRKPAELYLPIRYSLDVGGKRLRPILLLMAYNLFENETEPALPAAIAIEVFHNFTLLHDDIMDKAEVRRNKPTVHVKFNENKAILSGDAMAFLTYQYLMECNSNRLFDVAELFTQTALQVCEGQQYDMNFEKIPEVSEQEYMRMIQLKTAVLLGCSMKAGALLANAPKETTKQLYEMGIKLGLAFQVQDDWLDAFGNQQDFGKMIGGDILAGKKTYLLIKALELAGGKMKQELLDCLYTEKIHPAEKIKSMIHIYNKLGIKEIAEEKSNSLFSAATNILNNLHIDDLRKIHFLNLINNMQKRSS